MQKNKNTQRTTGGLIIDENMRNMKDKKQLFQELRKLNNIQTKSKYVKPTYAKDEEMDKIGETIEILNVNWEDVRAWKEGNRAILVNDTPEFIAKDNSYAEARINYAAALIASKLPGCDDAAASIVEAWSSQNHNSWILWVRATRESVTHLFKTRFKCKGDPGINFKAYVTKGQFENKKALEKKCKIFMDFDQEAHLQIRPGNSYKKDYQIWMRHRKNEEDIQLQIPTTLIHEIPTDAEYRANYNPGRCSRNNLKTHSQWLHDIDAMKIICEPIYDAYNNTYACQYGEH